MSLIDRIFKGQRFASVYCEQCAAVTSIQDNRKNMSADDICFKCNTCQDTGIVVRDDEIYYHGLTLREGLSEKCATCGKIFPSKRKLRQHVEESSTCS